MTIFIRRAKRCRNLKNKLGQLDLAEVLFRELIKIVSSEEGKSCVLGKAVIPYASDMRLVQVFSGPRGEMLKGAVGP